MSIFDETDQTAARLKYKIKDALNALGYANINDNNLFVTTDTSGPIIYTNPSGLVPIKILKKVIEEFGDVRVIDAIKVMDIKRIV